MTGTLSLDEAIQQLIELGEKDPLDIARKIEERNELTWISSELLDLREQIIAEMARQRLGATRRQSLATITRQPKREARLAPVWVPNEGWKRLADLTAGDLRALERFYAQLRDAAAIRVAWCADCIALMLEQDVRRLGQIKGPIPALPAVEEAA